VFRLLAHAVLAANGQYAFRNPASDHILSGEEPLAIDPATTTVPSLLKRAGYTSAVVGKWHIGVGKDKGDVNWNQEITPGPLEVGFDYAFYYPATNDRVPCVYVENHRVIGLDPNDPMAISYREKIGNEPTGRDHPEMLKLKLLEGHDGTIVDGISRIGFMTGGKAAWWKDEEMADTLTHKAVGFIERNRSNPFFLYFATHNIHQPRWPNPRFRGTSGCGLRCDAIREFDNSVGAILAALDRLKIAENTLVILSSDNGGAMDDGYDGGDSRDAHGHLCNGVLRGYKGSLWEGGNREPFIARWPRKIKAASESAELLCLVDLLATSAAITGQTLAADAGPDSFNMLPALLGEKRSKPMRDHLVMQAGPGELTIRKGPWKLIAGAGQRKSKPGRGLTAAPQLYNLADDLGEKHDIAAKHPEVVKELSDLMAEVRQRGRSRQ
jgi:arylsulfatase A-like enzyme